MINIFRHPVLSNRGSLVKSAIQKSAWSRIHATNFYDHYAYLKRWDGTKWVNADLKVYSGSSFYNTVNAGKFYINGRWEQFSQNYTALPTYTQNLSPKTYKITFGDAAESVPTGQSWNAFNYNTTLTSLTNTSGTTSAFYVSTAFWGGSGGDEITTGNNSGVYPDLILKRNLYSFGAGQVTFNGLDNNTTYSMKIYANSGGAGGNNTYTVGAATANLQTVNNTSNTITLTGLTPSNGKLILDVTRNGATICFLNVVELTENVVVESTLSSKQIAQSYSYYNSGNTTWYEQKNYVYFPADYHTTTNSPLIIYLAGTGEIGNGFAATLNNGLPRDIYSGKTLSAMVISPYNDATYRGVYNGVRWTPQNVREILDWATSKYKVNSSKIYLTGISAGGNGVWKCLLDSRTKTYFNKAWIHAGFTKVKDATYDTDLTLSGCTVADIPIRIHHGTIDGTVAYTDSTSMVNAITGCTNPVRVNAPQLIPKVGFDHDVWTTEYANSANFTWLFS